MCICVRLHARGFVGVCVCARLRVRAHVRARVRACEGARVCV